MIVKVPINVISEECEHCSRFDVVTLREYSGSKIVSVDLECKYYDDCLNSLDVYQRGMKEKERKK